MGGIGMGKTAVERFQLQTARETRSGLLRRRLKKGRSVLLFLTAPFLLFLLLLLLLRNSLSFGRRIQSLGFLCGCLCV